MFGSSFMPCRDCGASVEQGETLAHSCDPDRLLDYHLFGLRSEVARLDDSVRAFLNSPTGRFEVWQAHRDVRRKGR
jgi:hypothetical protein